MKIDINVTNKLRLSLSMIVSLVTSVAAVSVANAEDKFLGAKPEPVGATVESVYQLKIRFPERMAPARGALTVTCTPAIAGYESWADNNGLWTYSFQSADASQSPRLEGGTKCAVTQTAELKSMSGKSWAVGALNYDVTIAGPKVRDVLAAHGFKGFLREKDPVLLIVFDGGINKEKFFAEQQGYLAYLSGNAPAEKLAFTPVPADQEAKLLEHFRKNHYVSNVKAGGLNWVLATLNQTLIPGAKVAVKIQNVRSAYSPDVVSSEKHTTELFVRSQFQAEVRCTTASANTGVCLPNTPVDVAFNGDVKWADVKDSFIEYVPFGSKDGKTVRSFPELQNDSEDSYLNRAINFVAQAIPMVARFSDTRVSNIHFAVKIEAESMAKVVIPATLQDVDGRKLANAIAEFHLRIGSMREMIRMPGQLTFFEKNVPNLALPVGIVNLHQKLIIRKTGSANEPDKWTPVREMSTVISLMRAYALRGEQRTEPAYTSPLDTLKVPSVTKEVTMDGAKNRNTVLQFPFNNKQTADIAGFYALELSSPSLEKERSSDEMFLNPQHVLAQVTDLAVHMKRGQAETLVWVTRFSDGKSVAGADVEIYNCLGEKVEALKANAQGLATIKNRDFAADCQLPENKYGGQIFAKDEFYAVARVENDFTFTHSTWNSPHTYAVGAPGVEYFYSNITEGQPYYHAVVGVNLVKPGQKVPMRLFATLPNGRGFAAVDPAKLPLTARVSSYEDRELFYEFPLTWNNGTAELTWQVPADGIAKLGAYRLTLHGKDANAIEYVGSGEVEVAEFKVPLMTGAVSFPEQAFIQPETLPVSTVVRYANGVGAKNLPMSLAYYFEPASLYFEKFEGFTFANGDVKEKDRDAGQTPTGLPGSARPAQIENLATNADGVLAKDLAQENTAGGAKIADVLKTLKGPQTLVVRARYQDQMGEFQTLSQSKMIYNSGWYVGTNLVSGARAAAKLRAALVNAEGKVAANIGDLEMEVLRIETKVIGEELFGGLIKNTVEREFIPVRWNGACQSVGGIATCEVTALKAGSYAFQAKTKAGHTASHTLFKVDTQGRVYGEHEYFYHGDEDQGKQLPLAQNKAGYKDGERAVISFPAPFKTCAALVTLERAEVIDSFVQEGACEKGHVEIPVNAALAPNVFVSVYAISGRTQGQKVNVGDIDLGRPTYRLGFTNVKVDWQRFESKVKVATDKAAYEPGEMVNVSVEVAPVEGALVNGTVTLIAIEEKILELKANKTGELLNTLMQMRGHEVKTVTSLERVKTVAAENPEAAPGKDEAGRKGGDEGGDGGGEEFSRKLFDALVAFQTVPVVNGKAMVSFKANDSLTRFKVIAVTSSSNHKFGTAETVYLAQKDTQSFSNIPPVAHHGDSYPLKINIQNNTSKDQEYTAEVTVLVKDENGNVIETKKFSRKTKIGKSDAASVEVDRMTVHEKADRIEYKVRVYDGAGKLVDAMDPPAQIVMPAHPLTVREAYLVQMDKDRLDKRFEKEADAVPGKGELRVSLAKSLVYGARMQIAERMNENPYADFFVDIWFYQALLSGSKEKMAAAYDRLLPLTDDSGFVKLYPQAQRGNLWLTGSLLSVLRGEPWAMEAMPVALRNKLKNGVSLVLTKSVEQIYVGKSPMNMIRAQILMGQAAFVLNDAQLMDAARAVNSTIAQELARKPDVYGEALEKWASSDLADYWLLQVAAEPQTAFNSKAYRLLTTTRLVYTGNTAQVSGRPGFIDWYSDETIETAKLLSGISLLKGDKNIARALSAGIVNASRKGWYLPTTMAWVAGGLKKFGTAYETTAVTGTALITVMETKETATVDFGQKATGALTAKWPDQTATLQLTHAGQGNPWLSVQTLAAVPLKAPRGQGLLVEKTIRNISRDTGYQAGDIVEVELKLNAAAVVHHVAMLDPIPAGANIVGEAYGYYSSGEKSYRGYRFYFEALDQGVTIVKYQYQLNNPGTFKVPPTRAEGLYMPEVHGETPNAVMEVK